MKRPSVRIKDKDGRNWVVVHKARSEYDIKKRCSPRSFVGGWNRLGSITRYCEPRGDGLRWKDLAGNESDTHKSLKACLISFISEMETRRDGGCQTRVNARP